MSVSSPSVLSIKLDVVTLPNDSALGDWSESS